MSIIRLAMGIEYNGSAYHGWQRQLNISSIQEHLENSLSIIANEPITVLCAGRTDTGVHAIGQVVHFETHAKRSDTTWIIGVNSKLPADIAVRWVSVVPNNFHARFSAIARKYRYIIYNHNIRPAVFNNRCAHYYQPLDVNKMVQAGQYLYGENDFTSFRSSTCQSSTPWRNIHYLHITRFDKYVIIDIKANSFVQHMIRNIIGSLVIIGYGKKPITWIYELLMLRDRVQADIPAPAIGLYLIKIDYPSYFQLPINQEIFAVMF